ncbi:hypothetical protein [Blastococcus brunescens]|uniref:Polysaccharide biosynthesis protein n=1 Tax=Blastococcus brunescens TaxID=1564165 RepID=A0ABZ1AWI9_9ACTN|nr:hypothetical protein [Blastococcus sp. BMG 8361]WRL61733.1 hypothetical protein U6N30_16485 [Blastococcus sp. BMG 8361]
MAEPLIREDGTVEGTPAEMPAGRSAPLRAPRLLGPAAFVSVAFLGTNALSYVFTLLAARLLVPAAFGELAALLGVLLVGIVPATGLQTAAALYLGGSSSRGRPGAASRLHAAAWVTGLAGTAIGVLVVPTLTVLLHLPDAAAVGWLVALLLPSTLVAGYQGCSRAAGATSGSPG